MSGEICGLIGQEEDLSTTLEMTRSIGPHPALEMTTKVEHLPPLEMTRSNGLRPTLGMTKNVEIRPPLEMAKGGIDKET